MKVSKENDDAPKITGFLQCRRDAAHGRTPEPCVSAPAAESSSSALDDLRWPTDVLLVPRTSRSRGRGRTTITSQHVAAMPLNGRSYTDLLDIQAGVTPINTSANLNQSSGGGFGAINVSGDLNPGMFSINGQREDANGFLLNGANVQEDMAGGAAIIPNLRLP